MWSLITGGKTGQQWVEEYQQGHTHPVNKACHALGIPLISASIPLFLAAFLLGRYWRVPATLFTVGWGFQFLGHVFEGKRPEFMNDPRFLFVGLRWWAAKVVGRA
jgi:uncharacterized membrane protein YGL010W